MRAALILLADARFPGGGHAHSGGIEAAGERVCGLPELESFLAGRLHTAGRCAAGLAAAACRRAFDWAEIEAHADARMPSPAQRHASRSQGRGLMRAVRRAWPSPILDDVPSAPHHAIAIGAAAAAADLAPIDAAVAALYSCISGPSGAAVRLFGFDPIEVAAINARFMSDVDAVAAEIASSDELPADASPLLEIDAERHATWEVRLFAS